jgi:hypothetical protein
MSTEKTLPELEAAKDAAWGDLKAMLVLLNVKFDDARLIADVWSRYDDSLSQYHRAALGLTEVKP